MGKVFVSYSGKQSGWVWDRLVPVLRAGGIEVLIDRERFKSATVPRLVGAGLPCRR